MPAQDVGQQRATRSCLETNSNISKETNETNETYYSYNLTMTKEFWCLSQEHSIAARLECKDLEVGGKLQIVAEQNRMRMRRIR